MSKDTQLNVNEIGSTETQRGYFIPNKKNSVFVLESRTELYKLFLTETGDLYSFNEFGHEFLQLFLDKNTIFSIEKKKRFYQKRYEVMTISNDFKMAIGCKSKLKKCNQQHSKLRVHKKTTKVRIVEMVIFVATKGLFEKDEKNQKFHKTFVLPDYDDLLHLNLSPEKDILSLIYYTKSDKIICKFYYIDEHGSLKAFQTVDILDHFLHIYEIGWSFWKSYFNQDASLFLARSFKEAFVYDIENNKAHPIPKLPQNQMEPIFLVVYQ